MLIAFLIGMSIIVAALAWCGVEWRRIQREYGGWYECSDY